VLLLLAIQTFIFRSQDLSIFNKLHIKNSIYQGHFEKKHDS